MTNHNRSGRWKITRDGELTAIAVAEEGDTIGDLAETLGFVPSEWRQWLGVSAQLRDGLTESQQLAAGQRFVIPNTIAMIWYGNLGRVGKVAVRWGSEKRYAKSLGFQVIEYEFSSAISDQENLNKVLALLQRSGSKELHGLMVAGHGNPYSFSTGKTKKRYGCVGYQETTRALSYHLPLVVMHVCDGNWSGDEQAYGRKSARDMSSEINNAKNSIFFGVKGTFYPAVMGVPNWLYQSNAKRLRDVLKPGEHGT